MQYLTPRRPSPVAVAREGVTMQFIYEPEFWVAVSFFIFIGVLVYFGVHMKVVSALDARALLISQELEEARRLREEAEKVLADYRRKLGDVVMEVDNIIALATTEAKTLAAETRQSLKEHFDRRIKIAEEKIARAEMEAVRELRSDAVDAAIAAAQNLIAAKLTPDRAKKLVSESIKALKSKLN
jgi:F-type H+-transporting ATPase subunit b